MDKLMWMLFKQLPGNSCGCSSFLWSKIQIESWWGASRVCHMDSYVWYPNTLNLPMSAALKTLFLLLKKLTQLTIKYFQIESYFSKKFPKSFFLSFFFLHSSLLSLSILLSYQKKIGQRKSWIVHINLFF